MNPAKPMNPEKISSACALFMSRYECVGLWLLWLLCHWKPGVALRVGWGGGGRNQGLHSGWVGIEQKKCYIPSSFCDSGQNWLCYLFVCWLTFHNFMAIDNHVSHGWGASSGFYVWFVHWLVCVLLVWFKICNYMVYLVSQWLVATELVPGS